MVDDKLREWASRFQSLGKQNAEGDFVVDLPSIDVDTAKALISKAPVVSDVLLQECLVKVGGFGAYRASGVSEAGDIQDSPYCLIYLGDVTVPHKMRGIESDVAEKHLLYLGGIPVKDVNTERVIEFLHDRQRREESFIANHSNQISAIDDPWFKRKMLEQVEEKRRKYERVDEALKELNIP